MRIIFVRHGKPDGTGEHLTELGLKQAKAAAERLKTEKIDEIFSSTMGRALETAEHTAAVLSLKVTGLDFLREISWGSIDGAPIFENGHPWLIPSKLASNGVSLMERNWENGEFFINNRVSGEVKRVSADFDRWFSLLGYRREGLYYRVGDNTDRTVAIFSHGGSSSAVLAHMFNLPFPFVCSAIRPDFTAITVVRLSDEHGRLVAPEFETVNDTKHIEKINPNTEFFPNRGSK